MMKESYWVQLMENSSEQLMALMKETNLAYLLASQMVIQMALTMESG